MKKLSLLVAGLMLTAGVFAETVTKTVNELVTANKWKVSAGNDIQDIVTDFSLNEVISVSTTGEPNCGTFWTNKDDVTDWRLYQNKGGNVTIAAAEGYTLTSVTLAYNNKNNGVLIDNDDNVVANGSKYALSNVSSVTFAVSKSKDDGKDNGQAQITSFTVTYVKDGEAGEEDKPITIAEAIEKAKDTEVLVEGVMVAVAADGAVLQDETAMIYCYKNVEAVKVGDRVRATAKIAEYGGAKQLSNGTYQVLGTEEVTYPTAEKWTAETMDAWVADANREKKYVTFDATLKINGNYYNLTIEGATNTVSIIKPVEDIAAMDNSLVTVTGYAMYVSGSKTKYAYVVATSIKKATETAVENVVAEKKAHKVIENGVIYIIRNGVRYNALGAIAD